MDTRGSDDVIKAQVPMAEMLTYEQHLTSATGASGTYHMEYSHYEEVPTPRSDENYCRQRRRNGGGVVKRKNKKGQRAEGEGQILLPSALCPLPFMLLLRCNRDLDVLVDEEESGSIKYARTT